MKFAQIKKLLNGDCKFYMGPVDVDSYLRRKYKYNGRAYDRKEMWKFILDNDLTHELSIYDPISVDNYYFGIRPNDINSIVNLEVYEILIKDDYFIIILGYESNK